MSRRAAARVAAAAISEALRGGEDGGAAAPASATPAATTTTAAAAAPNDEGGSYVSEEDEDFNGGSGGEDGSGSGSGSDSDGGGRGAGSKRRRKRHEEGPAGSGKKKRGRRAGGEGMEGIDASEVADVTAEAAEAWGAEWARPTAPAAADSGAAAWAVSDRMAAAWTALAAASGLTAFRAKYGDLPDQGGGGLTAVGLCSPAVVPPLPDRARAAAVRTALVADAFLAAVNLQGSRSELLLGAVPAPARRAAAAALQARGVPLWSAAALDDGRDARAADAVSNAPASRGDAATQLAMAAAAVAAASNKKVAIRQTVKFAGQTMTVTKLVTAGTNAAKSAAADAAARDARASLAAAAVAAESTAAASAGAIPLAPPPPGARAAALAAAARRATAAAAAAGEPAFARSLAAAAAGQPVIADGNLMSGLVPTGPSGGGSSGGGGGGRGGGHMSLDALVSNLDKPDAISTLAKSSLDWDTYKYREGLDDDLAAATKGGTGYVDRQEFLQRVDDRRADADLSRRTAERARADLAAGPPRPR